MVPLEEIKNCEEIEGKTKRMLPKIAFGQNRENLIFALYHMSSRFHIIIIHIYGRLSPYSTSLPSGYPPQILPREERH
jgi:hypothetical protein